MNNTELVIDIKNLKMELGKQIIHDNLNFSVRQSEIMAIVGSSGSGKSVLLKQILRLEESSAGSIKIFGEEITTLDPLKFLAIQHRWGVMFQQGALFSSLTALENIAFPLREFTELSPEDIREKAMEKLLTVGLPNDAALKYPNQLSGGMQKRVALARACILDPELLFLDEPGTGLDSDSAAALDDLILDLKSRLGLTIVMVTHDLDSLWYVTDRVSFLGEGRVLAVDTMHELVHSQQPIIQKYFSGRRARATTEIYDGQR